MVLAELAGAGLLAGAGPFAGSFGGNTSSQGPQRPNPRAVAAAPTIRPPTRTLGISTATPRATLTPAPTPTPSELLEAGIATATAEGGSSATPTPSLTEIETPTPTPLATVPPTATPSLSPTVVPPFVDRRVQAGESLSQIAAEFGVSPDSVITSNQLSTDGTVLAGQMLAIPRIAGVVHTMQEGDVLSSIADLYGVSLTAIVEINNIDDASLVYVGQRFLIPGARGPISTSTPTPTPTAAPTLTLAPPLTTRNPTLDVPPTRAPTPTSGGRPARGRGGPNAPMRWPATADVSQLFGENGHSGIDIMVGHGDAVMAAKDGVVMAISDSDFGYGKRIEIDHGGGVSTLYGHLSAFSVITGQRVATGQRIGAAGDTGYSFGPHLHFEVRLAGAPVDPLAYLP